VPISDLLLMGTIYRWPFIYMRRHLQPAQVLLSVYIM